MALLSEIGMTLADLIAKARRWLQAHWPTPTPPPAPPPDPPVPPTPPDPPAPPEPAWTLPSRDEVLANLKADICMRADGDVSEYPGTGTWEALSWDDIRFHKFATAYKAAGHRLLPCSMVVANYHGCTFDYTDNLQLLISRLDRAHAAGLIPMLALNTQDGNGAGPDTLARLPGILAALKGHLAAAFTGWEIDVSGGPSLYTYEEHGRVIALAREVLPELVIGVEFLTPDGHEPIIFDGRGIYREAADYWRYSAARLADALLLRLPYDIVGDPKRVCMEVGGAVCRIQGAFDIPACWPDGERITADFTDNWRTDYGVNKAVALFEFASYLRWPSSTKRRLREYVQKVIPISGYGEG